jgi:hypothetical protein
MGKLNTTSQIPHVFIQASPYVGSLAHPTAPLGDPIVPMATFSTRLQGTLSFPNYRFQGLIKVRVSTKAWDISSLLARPPLTILPIPPLVGGDEHAAIPSQLRPLRSTAL